MFANYSTFTDRRPRIHTNVEIRHRLCDSPLSLFLSSYFNFRTTVNAALQLCHKHVIIDQNANDLIPVGLYVLDCDYSIRIRSYESITVDLCIDNDDENIYWCSKLKLRKTTRLFRFEKSPFVTNH